LTAAPLRFPIKFHFHLILEKANIPLMDCIQLLIEVRGMNHYFLLILHFLPESDLFNADHLIMVSFASQFKDLSPHFCSKIATHYYDIHR
jgi:hypothetical protein